MSLHGPDRRNGLFKVWRVEGYSSLAHQQGSLRHTFELVPSFRLRGAHGRGQAAVICAPASRGASGGGVIGLERGRKHEGSMVVSCSVSRAEHGCG